MSLSCGFRLLCLETRVSAHRRKASRDFITRAYADNGCVGDIALCCVFAECERILRCASTHGRLEQCRTKAKNAFTRSRRSLGEKQYELAVSKRPLERGYRTQQITLARTTHLCAKCEVAVKKWGKRRSQRRRIDQRATTTVVRERTHLWSRLHVLRCKSQNAYLS